MRLSLGRVTDRTIWLLTVFIFTSFLVFEMYSWGRYAFFGAAAAILFIDVIRRRWQIWFRLDAFHISMLVFTAYTLLSAVWALNASDAISKAITLLQIFGCAAMLYNHYQHRENVEPLLTAVMWAGYLVALYTIFFFGLEEVMDAAELARLDNEYSNVNSIGLAAACSCMIQVHFFSRGRHKISAVMMVPSVVVIAATQSRKALVLAVVGTFIAHAMANLKRKGFLLKLVRLLTGVAILWIVISFVYSLPLFDGVRDRMGDMLSFVTGDGKADTSTILRFKMIELGLEWFVKSPIFGYGMGNPHILAAQYLGRDTYLHNNFVEILCGGGLLGFLCYYGMYVYLFRTMVKYWKRGGSETAICMTWMMMLLVMDFGMVTYYNKTQWFYLMILFLNVAMMKRRPKGEGK